MMKSILRLEELAQIILGLFAFSQLSLSYWWFIGLILTPDIGMIGYVFGKKFGALLYNIFHHKGVAIATYLLGIYFDQLGLQLAGIILFSHSALDRLLGYGLKYNQGFQFTHLGTIGNQSTVEEFSPKP